jgi:hypothetical protein
LCHQIIHHNKNVTQHMKNITFVFAFAAAALSLTSCTRNLYTPTSQNIVLHSHANETQVGGSIGLRGLEGQGSYAVTDHIAIAGQVHATQQQGYFFTKLAQRSSTTSGGMGLAYYGSVGATDQTRWSVLGGFVRGTTTDVHYGIVEFSSDDRTATQHSAWYVQPMIGHRAGALEAVGSIRLASTSVRVTDTDEAVMHNKNYRFGTVEPALTLRYHTGRIAPFAQAALTAGGTKTREELSPKASSYVNLSVGLRASF